MGNGVTRAPSPTASPCPSSSWSARSGCASGAPGSRCSWSRTRAHGTPPSLGTKPPGPASCWQRGSGRLVGGRAAVRGCSSNAGCSRGSKPAKPPQRSAVWEAALLPGRAGRKEPQRGHIFLTEAIWAAPLFQRHSGDGAGAAPAQRGAPQRVPVLVSPPHDLPLAGLGMHSVGTRASSALGQRKPSGEVGQGHGDTRGAGRGAGLLPGQHGTETGGRSPQPQKPAPHTAPWRRPLPETMLTMW